ncbi:hypothetical protein NE689_00385 [Lactonifactor longoviformis]|uniref:hypothetical protein n=1 Tax=Lactonifactor longoviformis TaxID=341220 RepID=UPI00210A86A4|nr:hypothetical protein [Lactonifactor longoviformis]MCQ4669757.1 hypothetical protein [Lactonifactor longoviformis]
MYNKLILFRNELKNKTVPKYKIIGIVSELILSRQVFPRNLDIEEFLKEIFSLEFKTYLFKSRTLVVARVAREIIAMEKDDTYKGKLYKFVQQKADFLKDAEKKEKNQFDGWI